MNLSGNVLIVDDEESVRSACAQILKEAGLRVKIAENGPCAIELYEKESFDVVLVDLRLPEMDGMELMARLLQSDPDASVVMTSACATIEKAVEAMKKGAADFLAKPFTPETLKKVVGEIVEWKRSRLRDACTRSALEESAALPGGMIVGRSYAMRRVAALARKVSSMNSTVLITGPTGCGKEMVARTIHLLSPRCSRPFVTVDCGALVESLFESELFGHVKGAFTGAIETRQGKFQMADGGTLFLDEVSNISTSMQARLLRAIQEHEIAKVGCNQWEKVDVRIIAATNRNLEGEIKRGTFREDLFYRLNVFRIDVAPLSERIEDIPVLAEFFVKSICREKKKPLLRIDPQTMIYLKKYDWPGNVRELKNILERAIIICEGDTIRPSDLDVSILPSAISFDSSSRGVLENIEREQIVVALKLFNGHKTKTAEYLGINRKTLREKMRKYSILL